MDPEVSHYDVLGVGPDSSPAAVRAAYRRLVKAVHPDVGGTAVLFTLVREAGTTLTDPSSRARYDSLLAGAVPQPRVAPDDLADDRPAQATPRTQTPAVLPLSRLEGLRSAAVVLARDLRAKPRNQWVAEGVAAGLLTGIGALVLDALG